jgi:hypothetical protein
MDQNNVTAIAPETMVVTNFDVPVDMTEVLAYANKVSELPTVNSITGPFYMKEFLAAFNLASHHASRVSLEYERARDASRRARAVAHLDRAPEWLEKMGRKVTEGACEQYVERDPDYIQAREREAYLKALMELLDNYIHLFKSAHDDAKKIYDKTTNPIGSASALPSSQD